MRRVKKASMILLIVLVILGIGVSVSKHTWDSPLKVEQQAAKEAKVNLTVRTIGQPYEIK